MYKIQLFASTGSHEVVSIFPSLKEAIIAANALGSVETFEWGIPSAYRIIDSQGEVRIEARLRNRVSRAAVYGAQSRPSPNARGASFLRLVADSVSSASRILAPPKSATEA